MACYKLIISSQSLTGRRAMQARGVSFIITSAPYCDLHAFILLVGTGNSGIINQCFFFFFQYFLGQYYYFILSIVSFDLLLQSRARCWTFMYLFTESQYSCIFLHRRSVFWLYLINGTLENILLFIKCCFKLKCVSNKNISKKFRQWNIF